MKYLLIGSLPPPLGGVSVFLGRLRAQFIEDGHQVESFVPDRIPRFCHYPALFAMIVRGFDAIHVHACRLSLLLPLVLVGKGRLTSLTLHNMHDLDQCSNLELMLLNFCLRRIGSLVFAGADLPSHYSRIGLAMPHETSVRPAFLPPLIETENDIWNTYSNETKAFIDRKTPLIIANAFKIRFYRDADLYGLDMCVQLVDKLKRSYPDIGLLFALASIGDPSYFAEINSRLDTLRLRDSFHFMTDQKELWPLFRKADLMIRPTATDAYGVSVAEALHFGCPAIASDVCKRPEGTILFKNRDIDDLAAKCRAVLNERK